MMGVIGNVRTAKFSFCVLQILIAISILFPIPVVAQTGFFWQEDWEGNWFQDWFVEGGTWEVGMPTNGPRSAYDSLRCAATVLAGNYSDGVDTRILRATSFVVPSANENPRLRFFHWYSFSLSDAGTVEIRPAGGDWEQISPSYVGTSSNAWSRPLLDLSAYAGQTVQIAFRFQSVNFGGGPVDVSAGWFVDNVAVETGPFVFNNPEDFENGLGDWFTEAGTWEVGSGNGGNGYMSESSAATVQEGNYQEGVDSRLVSPPYTVPSADSNPRLRFFHWYSFSLSDAGIVEIKPAGGEWEQISPSYVGTSSNAWSRPLLDLSAYAGQTIQIAFRFQSVNFGGGPADVSTGWFVDNVAVETGPLVFNNPEDFENGLGDWFTEAGTWEVGSGNGSNGYLSESSAATVQEGNYHEGVDSRLVSPPYTVPSADSNPRLRFFHWYSFSLSDAGTVEIKPAGGEWEQISPSYVGTSSNAWSRPLLDLSAYAGQTIRIAFRFQSVNFGGGPADVSAGWFVDDVAVETGPFVFNNPDDFENGLGDWFAEAGTWEVGSGNGGNGYLSESSAATVLEGNYHEGVDSRLVSPPYTIPSADANPRLCFFHWFSFSLADTGHVEIRPNGGDWERISPSYTGTGGGVWSFTCIDLTAYAGQAVQFAFRFRSINQGGGPADVSSGWFVDDLTIFPVDPPRSDISGDVDLNQRIEDLDAILLLRSLVGSAQLGDQQRDNADVSLDKTISAWDASTILQLVAGSIDTLPNSDIVEATGTITMTDMLVKGSRAEVPLKLTNESNIYGFQITVTYNPSNLQYEGVNWADEFVNFMPQIHNDAVSGILRFAGAGSQPVNDASFLVNLNFGIKDTSVVDTTTVGLESLRWNEGAAIEHSASSELITDLDEQLNRLGLSIPGSFSLHQNYPNPFNPSTLIRYELPKVTQVKVEVYNLLGQRVALLVDEHKPAGVYEVNFDAKSLSTGVYIYKIHAQEFQQIRKMVLTK